MPKKITLKTRKNDLSVSAYLNSIEPAAARKDGKALAKLFAASTGATAKMWGTSIVGYGQYTYYRANGPEGEVLATGFSMRKSGPVLYIMPGYSKFNHLLKKLGPHKLGKSCLYLKNLENIDLGIIEQLIMLGLSDLKRTHSVNMK